MFDIIDNFRFEMKSIYKYITSPGRRSRHFVVATVLSASGSTPGKPGNAAVFSKKGLESGTIGGGIVEESVSKLIAGQGTHAVSCIYTFNLDEGSGNTENAICGGRVEILTDATLCRNKELIDRLRKLIENHIPFIIASVIFPRTGTNVPIERYILTREKCDEIPARFRQSIEEEVHRLLKDNGRSLFSLMPARRLPYAEEEVMIMLEAVFPSPHLVIAGAGHIGKAVCRLGSFLGFEVTVVDDRPEFANSENLPDANEIIVDDIGKAISKINKDSNTYIVIVTRGHASDADALRACIGSRAAYIGMIGSRVKTEKMHRDFISNGWATEEQWEKIHAPIGIKINSLSVEEIAVSIAAELVMVKNLE